MHKSEWLTDAQRVPVGQSRRIRHGAEGRPNLVVWNNPDSWSSYCHSCKEGGKVYKQMLQAVDKVAPVYRKYLDTKDLVSIDSISPYDYKQLVLLLHRKSMSTEVLRKFNPLYNTVDKRLVFRFDGVDIGRDCTELSHAKWLKYHSDNAKDYVYLQGRILDNLCEPVILVEDLFSAIKINHYTGWSVLCCLGTRIHDGIIKFISSTAFTAHKQVLHERPRLQRHASLAFDGDSAGKCAERDASARLGIRGLGYSKVSIPTGLDPKDLSPTELVETFKYLENVKCV